MHLVVSLLVAVSACARAGGPPPDATSQRQTSREIVIVNEKTPVPGYRLRESYGFVPVGRYDANEGRPSRTGGDDSAVVRRASRRGDDPPAAQGPVRRRVATRRREDGDQAAGRRPFRVILRPFRRSDQDKTQDRYSQTVKSPEGPVAIPLDDSKKGSSGPDSSPPSDRTQDRPPAYTTGRVVTGLAKDVSVRPGPAFLDKGPAPDQRLAFNVKTPVAVVQPGPVLVDPRPYGFGYGIDDGRGSTQFRQESTAGDGVVSGNYGYRDLLGTFRQVSYVADGDGFRAVVRTNEPGVLPVDAADVAVVVDPPSAAAVVEAGKYRYKDNAGVEVL